MKSENFIMDLNTLLQNKYLFLIFFNYTFLPVKDLQKASLNEEDIYIILDTFHYLLQDFFW